MEKEVLVLRNELVKKVDKSIKHVDNKEHSTLDDINIKLDRLENILLENRTD